MRKELEQVKNSWESSQTLDNILNSQKSQYGKSWIGFKRESSSAKDNARRHADILSSNPQEEKSSHKRPTTNPKIEERASPRKNVDSNSGYYNMYQTIFFGHYYY